MRTATGNAILIRLAASTMRDGATNAHELEALYDTYNYDLPGVTRKIHDFIRKCGIAKVSKRTIKLAQLAIDYFDNKERKIEMADLKDLYIPCPMCDAMMEYIGKGEPHGSDLPDDFVGHGTATYECKECECSITMLEEHVEQYATMIAQAHGIYNEPDDYQPTPEEEEAHDNELGHDEL